jgi:hypothetical protein
VSPQPPPLQVTGARSGDGSTDSSGSISGVISKQALNPSSNGDLPGPTAAYDPMHVASSRGITSSSSSSSSDSSSRSAGGAYRLSLSCRPSDVAQALWGSGRLGHRNGAFLSAACACLPELVGGWSDGELVGAVWGLGALRQVPGVGGMEAIAEQVGWGKGSKGWGGAGGYDNVDCVAVCVFTRKVLMAVRGTSDSCYANQLLLYRAVSLHVVLRVDVSSNIH